MSILTNWLSKHYNVGEKTRDVNQIGKIIREIDRKYNIAS